MWGSEGLTEWCWERAMERLGKSSTAQVEVVPSKKEVSD